MLCVLLCALSLSGCAAFAAVAGALPTVIQLVQDAVLVIDQIDSAARPFFEKEENAEFLKEYDEKMFVAKKSLQIALRASEGGKKLSDEEIDAAFADFRDAYKDLLGLLRDHGLMSEAGAMKASSGVSIDVEAPLALTLRSEK